MVKAGEVVRGCDLSVAKLERIAKGAEPFDPEIVDAAVRKLREQSNELRLLRARMRQIGSELDALKNGRVA